MLQHIQIVADHREANSGVIEALTCMENVTVEVRSLKLGDYRLGNGLVVERKRLPDLVVSIKDGRLFSQATRLASHETRAAVILEGQARDLAGSGMRREALLGAIVSLGLIYDLAVLRSSNPAETAQVLVYAARQLDAHEKDITQRHGKRPKRRRKVQLKLLQGLPGVGPKKAEAMLSRFGSVAGVLSATEDELQSVEGLGPTLARAIRWAVD
jgi:ERCC4-type nuclease